MLVGKGLLTTSGKCARLRAQRERERDTDEPPGKAAVDGGIFISNKVPLVHRKRKLRSRNRAGQYALMCQGPLDSQRFVIR